MSSSGIRAAHQKGLWDLMQGREGGFWVRRAEGVVGQEQEGQQWWRTLLWSPSREAQGTDERPKEKENKVYGLAEFFIGVFLPKGKGREKAGWKEAPKHLEPWVCTQTKSEGEGSSQQWIWSWELGMIKLQREVFACV